MCVSQGRLWALARSRSPAHSNTLWPPEDPPPTASEAEDPACRGHLRFRGGGSPAAIQHPGMSTDPQRAPPPIFRACRVPCQTACILYASWVSPPSPGHGQGSWSQEEGDGSSLGSLHVASDPEFHRKASNPSSSSDPCTAHHGMVGKPLVHQEASDSNRFPSGPWLYLGGKTIPFPLTHPPAATFQCCLS